MPIPLTTDNWATPADLRNTVDPPAGKVLSVVDLLPMLRTNSAVRAEVCMIVREEFLPELRDELAAMLTGNAGVTYDHRRGRITLPEPVSATLEETGQPEVQP